MDKQQAVIEVQDKVSELKKYLEDTTLDKESQNKCDGAVSVYLHFYDLLTETPGGQGISIREKIKNELDFTVNQAKGIREKARGSFSPLQRSMLKKIEGKIEAYKDCLEMCDTILTPSEVTAILEADIQRDEDTIKELQIAQAPDLEIAAVYSHKSALEAACLAIRLQAELDGSQLGIC